MNGPLILIMLAIVAIMASALFATGPNLKDALEKITRALPNGAATVYASPGLDTQKGSTGGQLADVEYILEVPAMNTTQMPDAKTMKYSILMDDVDPVDSSSTVLYADILTQTGAGGAGCVASSVRFKLPSDAKRIIGFKAVGSASGDATGASASLRMLL